MTPLDDADAKAFEALKRAVAEALERKRGLGQVFWRDGKVVLEGTDAPDVHQPLPS